MVPKFHGFEVIVVGSTSGKTSNDVARTLVSDTSP